jgi:hypothetical protein
LPNTQLRMKKRRGTRPKRWELRWINQGFCYINCMHTYYTYYCLPWTHSSN